MRKRSIDDETKEAIMDDIIEDELSVSEIAVKNKVSSRTIERIKKDGVKGKCELPINHPIPNFDERPSNKVDVIKTLQSLSERVNQHKDVDKDYAKIVIKSDKPIAVMKAADLHLGGLDISYDSLLNHYKFLLEEERFYLQLFGDDINMMIVHKTVGARHDILSPNEQCNLIQSMVDDLISKGKLLSLCWGNHSDEFSERNIGLSLTKLLFNHKIPYFRGMGYIDLLVGKEIYPMALETSEWNKCIANFLV